MENASKALLIAGGILIALIILTMALLMFNRMSALQNENEEETKLAQLSAFNAEFEAYNKKLMYGTDVITLVNKVAENNKKYASNNDYKITLIIDGTETYSSSALIASNSDIKLTIFTCTKVEYNAEGRISKMEIKTRTN